MASSNPADFPRVFLDSGVFLEGLLAPWSASRAVLVLSRRRVFKIILAKYVQGEVEANLLELLASDARLGNEIINVYGTPLALARSRIRFAPFKAGSRTTSSLDPSSSRYPGFSVGPEGSSRLVPDHEHETL
jgi:hypothetical protein